jgi:hypothetical protein
MGRPADEADGAIAQCGVGFVNREDQLKRNVEAFLLEEAELDGCGSRKVSIRDDVWDGDLHHEDPLLGPGAPPRLVQNRAGAMVAAILSWCRIYAPSGFVGLSIRYSLGREKGDEASRPCEQGT